MNNKRNGKAFGRQSGKLWLRYFDSKGLPREFARGQLDFEDILWRNKLGVSKVSDKTGEEESARVSRQSVKQTKELGQIRAFWSGRCSRGRWKSIGLWRAVGGVDKISPFYRPHQDHFVWISWVMDPSPDPCTVNCLPLCDSYFHLNHFSFLLSSTVAGYFPLPVQLGDRKKKEEEEEVGRWDWSYLGVARQGWSKEPKALGKWAVTVVPGGSAVLQGQPVSLSPLSCAGSSIRASHCWATALTYLSLIIIYWSIPTSAAIFLYIWLDVSLKGF